MRGVRGPDAQFNNFLSNQRVRIQAHLDRLMARYQQRRREASIQPHIEDRGQPQVWHRDGWDRRDREGA